MNIINKIIDYFLINIKEDKNSINYNKAKNLIIILILSEIIVFFLLIKSVTAGGIKNGATNLAALFLIVSILIIIKIKNYKVAGNVLVTSLLLLEILSMTLNIANQQIPYFLVGQYYVFFIVIIVGAMFASRGVFIITTIFIIISTNYIYFINKELIPNNIKEISENGFYIYQTMIVLCFVLSYMFTNFINKAIKDLSEKSQQIKSQNTGMLKVAEKIKFSSKELAQASHQLSSISEEMSQNAGEQAATTEEVASSMLQMLETIKTNTKNAESTYSITAKSSKNLLKTSKIILKTINLVNQIANKTEIISDIAFQTNILSINASITAVKAEKYGERFAVISHEIRSLAEKSKVASIEIEKLSRTGKAISQITKKALEKSLFEITRNSDLIKKIVNASIEQKNGAELVNNSIKQLSGITNQNSTSSEEMAAQAEELSAQAEEMKKIIAYL